MREVPLIIVGIGGVGRMLLAQIISKRRLHAERYGVTLGVIAVCDSRSAVLELGQGINDANLEDVIELKAAGGSLDEHALGGREYTGLAELVTAVGRPGVIVVDLTATEHTIPGLLYSVEQGYRIVMANKRPLTATQEVYDRLTRAGVTVGGRQGEDGTDYKQLLPVRWETTVGAGLPVISTQQRLVASGDQVHRIAGAFSGTLGYVMAGLEEGRAFSAIVREAYDQGYTEPDPRDDLGGADVARKALILARGLGWSLEMSEVDVTPLYPAELDDLSIAEFLDALPALDPAWAEQVQAAQSAGTALRYVARIEDGQCVVGPAAVAKSSPLGNLSGTDNLIEFHSRWYSPTPLVIQGRGAGIEVTAAGVLSDIIELTTIRYR
ncbi:MAG: homoserine dehydrogenase [Caldilineaceae bacterium]|nr:homoserine dehydrogenase [Caldilineaceae bacterium]